MPAPLSSVTFINKLPLRAFLPNVVVLSGEGGGVGGRRAEGIEVATPRITSVQLTGAAGEALGGKSWPLGSWGFWSENSGSCKSPPNMESGSGDLRSHSSCPENLGSRFSYLHFIDGNLRPKGKLVGMAAPSCSTTPLWVPASTPSRRLETPIGHAFQE